MSRLSDSYADSELERLEKKIAKEYRKAAKDLRKKTKDYYAKFKVRDKKMKTGLMDGSITPPPGETVESYYQKWRLNQIGRGERWEALRDQTAKRATQANQIAASYINDTLPGVYAFNANYEAYTIDMVAQDDIAWTLVDESTVKNLMMEQNHSEFRTVQVNPKRDYKWNKKRIQSELLSGILQGESIDELAKRYLNVMGGNCTAAIRNARTSVTSAQNGGRFSTMKQAKTMGIELKKEWICTLDSRTRLSHAMLGGEQVEIESNFSNGLLYPGDPDGDPSEVYNCRCTVRAVLPGINEASGIDYRSWLKKRGIEKED